MHYYEVAPTKIIRRTADRFTYASEAPLEIGTIVMIEVGKKEMIGVVVSSTTKPLYETKPVSRVVIETPLPEHLVLTSLWMAHYYQTPLATVLQTVLPRGLDKKRRQRPAETPKTNIRKRTTIVLNDQQEAAVASVMAAHDRTVLLQGVTGSGKTEVYKAVARQMIEKGRSVIVLVPEISLTSQLIAEFLHDFPDVIVTHSHMTEAERHVAWLKVMQSEVPVVIIGPRSALFMPVRSLGAIFIDEAHEPSYKQEQAPRYSALRVGSMMARYAHAVTVLGSATPSVADRYLAEAGRHPVIHMDTPARKAAIAPSIQLIDMTKRENFKHHRFLSDRLIATIETTLDSGKQSLLFHNRRGSAATTLCEDCGWSASCPRCHLPLSLHADRFQLRCHICGHTEKVPTHCPVCQSTSIIHKGIGTKLIESELQRLFPKARIARFDSDTAQDSTIAERYDELYKGEIDIAIGTQVVAKGLDLPHLRTVGVIQADSGLALPDFAASERAFQLLSQVIGRVGRDKHETSVIIQSYQPTHPAVQLGLKQDYEGFYEYALEERRRGHFPPFTYLLRLTTVYKSEAAAVRAARSLADELKKAVHPDVRLFGPTPSFYERQHDTYRWQLILKSPKREHLIDALKLVPPTHWQTELDPHSLL